MACKLNHSPFISELNILQNNLSPVCFQIQNFFYLKNRSNQSLIFTDCTALKSKWKCTPSQSCDWFHKVLKAFGKYSKGDRKYQKYKDFYNDRKCDVGHVYCSTNGKFPTYDGDLPKLKRCS